jgi:PST family polysaccharide transporter
MTGLFSGLVLLLAEFGAGTAVIKMRDLDEKRVEQLHGLAFATGLIALGLGALASHPISIFFERSELRNIVLVSSLGFVFTALQTVPSALLQRALRFRLLATIEFAASVLLAVLVLIGAKLGLGYWSLVIPGIVVGAINVLWLRQVVPVKLRWPVMENIKEAAHFSSWVFAGRVGGYLFATSDFLVVGKVLGNSELGSYQFAWTLANTPNDQVNGLVARVSGSFYSAVQSDAAEIARLYKSLLASVALISVPLVVGLGAVAPEFIELVLGTRWSAAVRPLQLLCLLNTVRVIPILAAPVLQMTGEVRFQARTTFVGLAYLPIMFFFAAKAYGSDGVALAWLIGYPPLLLLIAHRTSRRIGLSRRDFFEALFPAFASSIVMAFVVFVARTALPTSVDGLPRLAALIASGAATFAIVLFTGFRSRTQQVIRTLKMLRK